MKKWQFWIRMAMLLLSIPAIITIFIGSQNDTGFLAIALIMIFDITLIIDFMFGKKESGKHGNTER